jgi:hypothetical protein
MNQRIATVTMLALTFCTGLLNAESLPELGAVTLTGPVLAGKDVSAIERVGDFLLIGADEGVGKKGRENYVQVLRRIGAHDYEILQNVLVFDSKADGEKKGGKEMDIEGLAVDGRHVYVIGSHGSRRRGVDADRKYGKNRKRLGANGVRDAGNRDQLIRMEIDAAGGLSRRTRTSLRDIIKADEVLGPFHATAAKENGINIEGLAARDGWLYVGFRAPVLRGNWVPVMRLKFDDPADYTLRFVKLGGRGIRGMASASKGFVLLAGPMGDGPGSYQVYQWDGKDMVPGSDRADNEVGRVHLLGEVAHPDGGKAEGIVVLEESATAYELLIVFDGVEQGIARRYEAPRP